VACCERFSDSACNCHGVRGVVVGFDSERCRDSSPEISVRSCDNSCATSARSCTDTMYSSEFRFDGNEREALNPRSRPSSASNSKLITVDQSRVLGCPVVSDINTIPHSAWHPSSFLIGGWCEVYTLRGLGPSRGLPQCQVPALRPQRRGSSPRTSGCQLRSSSELVRTRRGCCQGSDARWRSQ
jgi:hypothetical protein